MQVNGNAEERPVIEMRVTSVFNRNWDAVHAVNPDGTRRYKYIANKWSSRSSKTYSLIDCFDTLARKEKNKRFTIWRDTKVDCVDTVWNDLEKRLMATGRWQFQNKFNATKTYLRYATGSRVETHGADDSVSVHGLNQNAAWLNEPYKISKDVFDQIDQRTEDFIFIDWNPRQAHWVEDLERDERTIVINSTFRDNPFCPEAQREKILSYQTIKDSHAVLHKLLTPGEAETYSCVANPKGLAGKYTTELARCQNNEYKRSANAYNWSVYGLGLRAEKPNRIFSWSEISLAEYLALDVPLYYGCDWGICDPWAISEVKYYDGGLYVRELNYSSENTLRDKMTLTDREQILGAEEGIVNWLFSHLAVPFTSEIICDPNRRLKILALRQAGWEYAIAAPKPPGSIIDGISLLSNLRVYFTADSVNVRQEQENYSRKVDRYGIVLEEPEDLDNHHMDAVRYVATYLQTQGVIK